LLFLPLVRAKQKEPQWSLIAQETPKDSTMVLDVKTSYKPTILERSVGGDDPSSELVLLLLGCEAKPPYGPYLHTATLFLDLICRALEESSSKASVKVIIKVYEASQGHFPEPHEYESCNGVILPGSFNSAYDEEPWIHKLKNVIQTELVANQRPTLGVCFGHQLYAHSFPEGGAVKCPAGHQAGQKVSTLTQAGRTYFGDDDFQLFYTHGDMVERLPPCGINLGGTEKVPVQAALYLQEDRPVAVTFQAHPEYGTSRALGLERTLKQIIGAMEERGGLSAEERKEAEADADREFDTVERKSVQTMITVGKLLGWFP
jgi:GMP synthase-like glutamine amidotransferase